MEQDNRYSEYKQMEEDEPIDWAKYVAALLKNWKKIAILTFISAVLSVIVALNQSRVYNVSVTLAPESSGGSRGGAIGGLASMFGVNLGGGSSSSDAMNITVFPEIAASTPFLTSLFDVELDKMPKISNQVKNDPEALKQAMSVSQTKVKLFDHMTGRDSDPGIIDKIKSSIFGSDEDAEDDSTPDYTLVDGGPLTMKQYLILLRLKNMISVDVDKKTAMTTISVSMGDPLMCAQLADTVCRRLREYVYNYRTEKERRNFEYYEAMCDSTYKTMVAAQAAYASSMDNNQNVILQKVSMRSQRLEQEASVASQVYQQMVQQREMSRAELQAVKPVFAVVEPATVPIHPKNSRARTCMMITFVGFILSCAWFVIGEEYCKIIIKELRNKLSEVQSA